MSLEILRQWQCDFCSASFPTHDLLQHHFDEYRSRAAELERCKTHADAGRARQPADESLDENEAVEVIKANTRCPFPGCERVEPFKRGQQLRVHFRTHITCEEVCVCCFRVFRVVSEYIRHSREHGDATERKTTYINDTCEEQRRLSNAELTKWLSMTNTTAKKRTWNEASLELEMLNPQRSTNESALQSTGHLHVRSNNIYSSAAANPSVMPQDVLTQVPLAEPGSLLFHGVTGSRTDDAFGDSSKDPYPPVPEDHGYDPPLFMRLNFPIFPSSLDESLWLTPTAGEATGG